MSDVKLKIGVANSNERCPKPLLCLRSIWLLRIQFSRTLEVMEVHFTPEQEAQLAQVATSAGTDAERFVKDAVLRLLEGEVGFRSLPPQSVVAKMRALRARVKPDPEGWTTRDYVHSGRR